MRTIVLHDLPALHRWLIGLALALGLTTTAATAGPTPEEYVQHVGGGSHIIKAGKLRIGGLLVACGHRPTVIDNNLDDYGAAYPGFLILNRRLLANVPNAVKLWIFAHECGHQFRGPDEETADCFAVQRGRRQKWLTPSGLDKVCAFIHPARGDSMHLAGPQRCKSMRRCYYSRKIW
ncbi:MAG: hypothetical protein AAFR04_07090 [Pseudomonadota bacterium]